MALIHCDSEIPSAVQVGTPIVLHCAGDEALKTLKSPQIKIDGGGNYDLVLLTSKSTATGADFVLTSYTVGAHQWPSVHVQEGTLDFEAGPLTLNVQSVMNPKEPRSEPFGPQGPLGLHLPWWFWAGWAILIVAVITAGIVIFRRWRKRRQDLQKIETENATQEPVAQWNLRLRGFLKRLETHSSVEPLPADALSPLQSALTVYLARRFQVSPFAKSLVRERRRGLGPLWSAHGEKLLQLEREILRLQEKLQAGVPAGAATADLIFDMNHVTRDLRTWVDQVEAERAGTSVTVRGRR